MSKRQNMGTGLRMAMVGAALQACAGCASTAYLDLDSDPPGAFIRTRDGVDVGTAPVSVRLGTIPVSAWEGTNGWAPGKTYVASKDGYEAVCWSPRLSLATATRTIGLPHTWNHVFVLSPKPTEAMDASPTGPESVRPSAKPPEPRAFDPLKASVSVPLQSPPVEPLRSQAPKQSKPAVEAAGSAGSGMVLLTAEPDNADIVVDGRFVGNSPATLRLPEGTHVVEVKMDGLQPYRKEIHVTDKSEQTLRARLLP
jgi:hypothetical protein